MSIRVRVGETVCTEGRGGEGSCTAWGVATDWSLWVSAMGVRGGGTTIFAALGRAMLVHEKCRRNELRYGGVRANVRGRCGTACTC